MQCFDAERISAYVLIQEVCQIWSTKKKPWKHCVSKAFWRSGWDSNPRALADNLISSQSRYPDFEGKQRKLTDNARVCKPLKNQHFSALKG